MSGAWDRHHQMLDLPIFYGAPETYRLAAEWVADCGRVEDWGCGGGGLTDYIDPASYVGVDGSGSPFATVNADLVTYDAESEGIVLRHVLEHNYQWRIILENAVQSFTKRLCIVVFTPLVGRTHLLHTEPEYGDVPVIAFAVADLVGPLVEAGVPFGLETRWYVDAHFGTETIIYAQR